MVYLTTSSSGWGQLPIGFIGYKEAQRTLLQKHSLDYQKEKSIGGVVPLLNHLSSQLEMYEYVINNIKGLSVLHFVVRVFFLFSFPHKYFIYISMKFGCQSTICECVNLCGCLYELSLPIGILLLFITHSLYGDQTLQ